MVDSCARRTALRVEQWQARHNPGDFVTTGETLGFFARRPIRSPYAAVVENVAFERESRTWLVTLVERIRCN